MNIKRMAEMADPTGMEDAEISRRLALAIGWDEKEDDPDIIRMGTVNKPEIHTYVWHCEEWVLFDYRDPAVIWPIAERFDCFPAQSGNKWVAVFKKDRHPVVRQAVFAETAAKAVALAVIKAHEGAKE